MRGVRISDLVIVTPIILLYNTISQKLFYIYHPSGPPSKSSPYQREDEGGGREVA
ncbi:MAG: hypothetical protein MK289_01330 [Trichodesmium sp. ALOHA_ZT_67]|nr:hypothetical protein [Trichodesmium sp. ALOHA_ZT_67]MDE5103907.1 hypothetical protein [Trichodesmium sp. St19_bin2]